MSALREELDGLWRGELRHPAWTEEEGGEEGWDPTVSWWAARTSRGLLLIDPLVGESWDALDRLVERHGGCAGIVRTVHWHQRDIAAAAERYGAAVLARPGTEDAQGPRDRDLGLDEELWDGIRALSVHRADELALWLPAQRALVFGDVMLRRAGGRLRICPDWWVQPEGGPPALRLILARLAELPVAHALVSHGPNVLGDGAEAMRAALSA